MSDEFERTTPRSPEVAGPRTKSRFDIAIFRAKVLALQGLRCVRDWRQQIPLHKRQPLEWTHAVCENRSPLWSAADLAEERLQLGKVQNLRLAARKLDGVLIPAGEVFSFWRQVGRATAQRGFAEGRMLEQGCIVPSVGGGLCQLSNALYQVALAAQCEIVERHTHSRIVPGSAAEMGEDATIAWNYVDLRFRPRRPFQLRVRLSEEELVLTAYSDQPQSLAVLVPQATALNRANNCFDCGQQQCHRHAQARRLEKTTARRAFLVDENWPEFQDWLRAQDTAADELFLPLNGGKWKMDRYRWPTERFHAIHTATLPALQRSWQARRLAQQGAGRQMALFEGAEALAKSYARQLQARHAEIVVAQSLLPFLWRDGALGGRRFSVWMTRLPIARLEAQLNAAQLRYPEQRTLSDFRAPAWIREAESEALAAASKWVTPHLGIAALAPQQTQMLPWILPKLPAAAGSSIVFPGPAIARRGAFLVREAARKLNLKILTTGPSLEGAGYWQGLAAAADPQTAWYTQACAVVLPAFVEHQPRALLTARAAGIPVYCTPECGLLAGDGVTFIHDAAELEFALQQRSR
ncbi:VanW family protein [Bryobacter aggregatus]|uniref:VanW family protein n=1 Tax=Bryobacter aggregatus TaxID=360054 RepID=UPI000689CAD1|nr:VanW family protein [Bryobacter aggregatus]